MIELLSSDEESAASSDLDASTRQSHVKKSKKTVETSKTSDFFTSSKRVGKKYQPYRPRQFPSTALRFLPPLASL